VIFFYFVFVVFKRLFGNDWQEAQRLRNGVYLDCGTVEKS
jgi:hypothetical protein